MKIRKLSAEQIKAIICILLLFSITSVIFCYTVEIREPWFGELSGGHQWLTGDTILFSKIWYRDGPQNLGFAMVDSPASIEFTNLSSRGPYLSYLPGSVVPIYFLSELTSTEPNPAMVMSYNLFNHFFIALLLSLLVFVFLRQLKVDYLNSFLFAIIPIIMELLLPGPLYWHQNVYFADQAVILPFVLYVFLEIILDGHNGKYAKYLCILQNLVLFWGIFTDWLFVFVAFTVYVKRIFEGKVKFSRDVGLFLKESFKFWLAPILAVIFYISQIFYFNHIELIIRTFFFRSGISPEGSQFLLNGLGNFKGHIFLGYGEIGFFALCFSLIIFLVVLWLILFEKTFKKEVDPNIKRIFTLMGMLLVPCILQVLVFRNHSVIHNFSILKFSLPLVTIPFVLAPILLYLFLKSGVNLPNINLRLFKKFKIDFGLFIIFLVMFSVASFYVADEHPHYKELFPGNGYNFAVLGDSIAKNTVYSDIVFSPNFEIKSVPPQQLSYSMKKVYKINSTEDIGNFTKGLSGYHVVILFVGPPEEEWQRMLANATLTKDGVYYYYRLN
jgi:hypothetical protein